ncbi:DUF2218 domain-containing protein [Arenibaculum pallidiluteum]|uniref:DUF2218 domain-containing protein n=1 Tax=Arenibaculum pallidiluteum TaxID=2812559 RepID=UPI001A95D339|nr:DUF2218 domain-containing protein [Arenibaculum pallidiluteum]
MIRSQTYVPTANGSRYLVQLCKHWGHKFEVVYTPEAGRVPFAPDRACSMAADPGGLTLTIEAPDGETATRLEGVVMDHLRRFAFREELPETPWTRIA